MPLTPDLFRALGVLCETPEPAHRRLADALGLPGRPDAADHTELFVLQLVPYASVYLSPDGMLGGETADRIAGFWRALHLIPPPEPDHLAALLGLYATLAEHAHADPDPARAALWHQARRALLWEHLLTWLLPYTAVVEQAAGPFYTAWARLLDAALRAEAQALSAPSTPALHLRESPAQPDPDGGLDPFVRALLAPARSGLLLTRTDLVRGARGTGVGLRIGERAFVLRSMLSQDPAATLDWLVMEADRWAERHRAAEPVFGDIARTWRARAEATSAALSRAQRTATEWPMSHDTQPAPTVAADPAVTEEDVRRIVREEVERAFRRDPATRTAAIIASKGTLDWAYPPLILANAAAAVGMDVSIFFTFYGLNIIHRDAARKLKIDPVGNPAMPMPVPVPDIVSSLPGMVSVASAMMRSKFAKKNVATIAELITTAKEADVRLIACQMTVDVFGYAQDDFIDGVEFAGAAAFMARARKAHVTLFV